MTNPVGPVHLLLVDDDADLRESVAALLHSSGHRVVEAAHGQLALDMLAADPSIGLIILDLMMPVMDGLTFLAQKARGAHAATPVVIFSSSLGTGLKGHADVVSVIHKLDGIDGLLAGIRSAFAAAPVPAAEPTGRDPSVSTPAGGEDAHRHPGL